MMLGTTLADAMGIGNYFKQAQLDFAVNIHENEEANKIISSMMEEVLKRSEEYIKEYYKVLSDTSPTKVIMELAELDGGLELDVKCSIKKDETNNTMVYTINGPLRALQFIKAGIDNAIKDKPNE